MNWCNNKGLLRNVSQEIQEVKTFGMDFCPGVSANSCWPSSWNSESCFSDGTQTWGKNRNGHSSVNQMVNGMR